MDPMMMAIIAVVVLVLIAGAFFFMKSRGTNADTPAATASNRPKTLAEQQREMEQQRFDNLNVPVASPEPVADPLVTAQQYIQRQDFAQAITTLKNAIQQDGQRSALYLHLLNIFAQQKDITAFNQYLTPLLALNNPSASSQAMSLKKLLDDEMAFEAQPMPVAAPVQAQAVPVASPVVSSQPESLDFDGFDFNDTATTPAVQPVMSSAVTTPVAQVKDSLSFDEIEFPSLSTPPVSTSPISTPSNIPAVTTPTVTGQVADDLDFNFDDADMGLSAPTTATPVTPTATVTPSSDLDDFSFDFDEPANATGMPVASPTPSVVADTANFDDDFSFDEPATTPVTPSATTSPVTPATPVSSGEDLGEFDFEMDEFTSSNVTPAQSTVTPAVTTPVAQAETVAVTEPEVVDDFDFDFEDTAAPLAASLDTEIAKVAEVAEPTVAEHTVAIPPVAKSIAASPAEDFSMEAFDFDLDEVKAEPTIPTPTMPTPTMPESLANASVTGLDDSTDMVFGLTDESRPETLHTNAPASTTPEVSQDVSEDFDLDFDMPASPTASEPVANPAMSPAVTSSPVIDTIDTVAQPPVFSLDDMPATPAPQAIDPVISQLPTATTDISNEYDTLNQLDNLYATETSPVTPQVAEIAPTAVAPTVTTAATSFAMDNDFMSVVNGLDTIQLNLDLASQYVQLGEYDSAKRLLSEIKDANPQQQQQISHLLVTIG